MTTPQAINRIIKLTAPPQTATGKKGCTFCKPEGFIFLPLRYAVVSNMEDAPPSMWPALTYPLGDGVIDRKLTTSRYTVRLLREGFLYVLVIRNSGASQWQAYAVTAAGMLSQFSVGKPPVVPPVFTCDLATDGVGASFVSVVRVEEVKSIHVLFSPDVLPVSILEKREGDRLGMQALPARQWRGHAHVLQAPDLEKWVAEFKLNTDGMHTVSMTDPKLTGRRPFAQQLYPLMRGPSANQPERYDDHLRRLTALKNRLQQTKSPALVLWDPIGITQELNLWHRHIADEIDEQLRQGNRERQIETSGRIMGLKGIVEQQGVESAVYANPEFTAGPWGAQVLTDPGAREQAKAQAWSRYQLCYDEAQRAGAMKMLEAAVNAKLSIAEQRFSDLDGWLGSQTLLNALENYSTWAIESGLLFHTQVALCTYAIGTSMAGIERLKAWRADEQLKPSNLMARQLLFNQEAAIAEVRKALQKARGQADINVVQLQSMLSATAGVFDKANDLASMANEGRVAAGAGGIAGKLLTAPLFVASVGTTIFAGTGAPDKVYAFLLYARAIPTAMMQAGADAVIGIFNAIYPSTATVPLEHAHVQRAQLQTLMKEKGSDFAALHLGAAIVAIEALNLCLKRSAFEKGKAQRDRADLVAAYMATTAASAVALSNIAKVLKGESSPWFSHLRLVNGMLGSVAAGMVAWENVQDWETALGGKRYALAFLCLSKSTLNGLVALGSAVIGGLYSAPLLAQLGKMLGDGPAGDFLHRLSAAVASFAEKKVAIGLAEKVAVRVVSEALVAGVGWILLAETLVEFGISALTDNRVQIWLTRCTFHKPAANYRGFLGILHDSDAGKPYPSLDEELQALDTSLKGGVRC